MLGKRTDEKYQSLIYFTFFNQIFFKKKIEHFVWFLFNSSE